MGLQRAARHYHVRRTTLKKLLPYLEHRVRSAKSRTYIEVNTKSLDKVLRLWLVGPYGRQDPDEKAEYVTTRQAADVSGLPSAAICKAILKGELKAIRSPTGHWLVESESLRAWACRRPPRGRRRYLWLQPLTNRERGLVAQFFRAVETATVQARQRNVDLGSDWITKLIAEMHKRQARQREDGLYSDDEGR